MISDPTPELHLPAEISLTRAQATQVAHWEARVAEARRTLEALDNCRIAALSAIVAGHQDGVWQIIAIDTGEDPRLVIQPADG